MPIFHLFLHSSNLWLSKIVISVLFLKPFPAERTGNQNRMYCEILHGQWAMGALLVSV